MKHSFKKAFISGASSGIGSALAHLLAKEGIGLFLTGRNETRLQHLVDELSQIVEVSVFVADLVNPEERKVLIAKIKEYNPDLVINNAGFGIYGNPLNSTLEEQRAIIEINAIVPFEMTYEMAVFWHRNSSRGTIMNVSSVAAELLFPWSNVYASSKSFLSHFSRTFDIELQHTGIRILTCAPGQVSTNFSARASRKEKKDFSQPMLMSAEYAAEQILKQIFLKKTYHIFNAQYRFFIGIVGLIPLKWVANFLKKRIVRRIR